MSSNIKIYKEISELSDQLLEMKKHMEESSSTFSGLCGFDGFIDTFIRMEDPSSMESFGSRVSASAGIAASYRVRNKGDMFGGNGPLFASAISDIFKRDIDLSYIGAVGKDEVAPLFQKALKNKVNNIYTLADPAHSDCLEFTDGKIMLNDLSSCEEVTWERLIEVMGEKELNSHLKEVDFIAALNWGKLRNVGEIWKNIALKLCDLAIPEKKVQFFMDLAEFEHRPEKDIQEFLKIIPLITKQTSTILSFNLKEAWEMGDFLGRDFRGKKDAEQVTDLAVCIKNNIDADKVIIHPNDGAVCSGVNGSIYIPGPYCKEPLISTGAGDNFGAGCMAASLKGMDDIGMLLTGVCTSGYFVRTGKSPSFQNLVKFIGQWMNGTLPD